MQSPDADLPLLIRRGEIETACTGLARYDGTASSTSPRLLEALAVADDDTALACLADLLDNTTLDPQFRGHLIQLTIDRAHLNFRFAPLLLAQNAPSTLQTARPLFRHILARETDPTLIGEIFKGVGRHRLDDLSREIAEFVFFDDAGLKRLAVQTLQDIGGPMARDCLLKISKTDKSDPQVRAALAAMASPRPSGTQPGPKTGMEQDRSWEVGAGLANLTMDQGFQALTYFAAHPRKLETALAAEIKTGNRPAQLLLLEAAARGNCPGIVHLLSPLLSDPLTPGEVRCGAHAALAALPVLAATDMIHGDTFHGAPAVRMAALMALDRHGSPLDLARLRSIVESGTPAGHRLTHSLLDGQCRRLIHDLMGSDSFIFTASNYLETAPLPVLETFIQVLEDRQQTSTRAKYRQLLETRQREMSHRPWAAIVCPLTVPARIQATQVQTAGFQARIFKTRRALAPALALEKPGAVLCDLFLDDCTAVALGRQIREGYSREQLPLLVSSPHIPLASEVFMKEIHTPEINHICTFPVPARQLTTRAGRP